MFVATSNPAKRQRLRLMLQRLGLTEIGPESLEHMPAVQEGTGSHADNARMKAEVWSRHTGLVTVATDGGLVIPALGTTWNTVLTGRFAGLAATDRDKLDRLIQIMYPHSGTDRAAYWVEALTIAKDGQVVNSWQVESPRGLLADSYDPDSIIPGFWAFSLWYLPKFGKTRDKLTLNESIGLDDHWKRLERVLLSWFETRGNALLW